MNKKKTITIPLTPEQRESLVCEAKKRNVTLSKYVRQLCGEDNTIAKKEIKPLVEHLNSITTGKDYRNNHTILQSIHQLNELLVEDKITLNDAKTNMSEKITLSLDSEQYDYLTDCAEKKNLSRPQYLRKQIFSDNDISKTDIIPVIYKMNESLFDSAENYNDEKEVLKEIWKLI